MNELTSNYETPAYLWKTTPRGSYLIRLAKRLKFYYVDICYVQNDVTIRLNRSTERKYKRNNNERTMVSK